MATSSATAAAAAAAATTAGTNSKYEDLLNYVDTTGCYGKNVSPSFPMTNLFVTDSRLGVKSDTDEQLILHIPFQQFVKIHSMEFLPYQNGREPDHQPTLVHVFVNRCNLGFEDVQDVEPTQTFELTAPTNKPIVIPTKFVKYQRVSSITLFIEENCGDEEVTSLGGLRLFGKPVATTNMNEFKAQKG